MKPFQERLYNLRQIRLELETVVEDSDDSEEFVTRGRTPFKENQHRRGDDGKFVPTSGGGGTGASSGSGDKSLADKVKRLDRDIDANEKEMERALKEVVREEHKLMGAKDYKGGDVDSPKLRKLRQTDHDLRVQNNNLVTEKADTVKRLKGQAKATPKPATGAPRKKAF